MVCFTIFSLDLTPQSQYPHLLQRQYLPLLVQTFSSESWNLHYNQLPTFWVDLEQKRRLLFIFWLVFNLIDIFWLSTEPWIICFTCSLHGFICCELNLIHGGFQKCNFKNCLRLRIFSFSCTVTPISSFRDTVFSSTLQFAPC